MSASSAEHPFNEASADIIIYSSDNVSFRVHTVILALASEFFKDMLSLPQPSATTAERNDGLPSITVSEPAEVLERLFRLCYPIDDPVLESIAEVSSTLEAAMKYQMAEATKLTKRKLRALAASDPLRVYAVACRYNLEEEACAAAKEVLRQKAQERYAEELEDISIGAYHRLLSYCERRGKMRERFRFTVERRGRGDADAMSSAVLVTPEPEPAPSPFDHADAEVRIVTSDGVEFHVFQRILQLSSPILYTRVKELLASSAPLTIPVTEPSRIMSHLLHICYPTSEPVVEDIHDISTALAAAEKYEMHKASQVLRSALTLRKDSPSEDPVVLYAIACRFGMRELAIAAARRTLRTEVMRAPLLSDLDSIGVSGGCLYRLLDYHRRCRTAVRAIFDNTDWIEEDVLAQLHDYCRRGYSSMTSSPCWYDKYMRRVAEEGLPRAETVTNPLLLQSVLEENICHCCSDVQGAFLLIKFSKYVADTVDSLEKKITLHWSPPSAAQ